MRTVAQSLEKAEAFEQLASTASNDMLRASYLDLARGYREIAKLRSQALADEGEIFDSSDGQPGLANGPTLWKRNGGP